MAETLEISQVEILIIVEGYKEAIGLNKHHNASWLAHLEWESALDFLPTPATNLRVAHDFSLIKTNIIAERYVSVSATAEGNLASAVERNKTLCFPSIRIAFMIFLT